LSVSFSAYSTKKLHGRTWISEGDQNVLSAWNSGAQLQLLASIPFGATETIMLAHHGFKLADLVPLGLQHRAAASTRRGKTIGAGRVRITAARRSALED
jgi:hypothetical protein